MKTLHEKLPKDSFEPGRTYTVHKDGKQLYKAEVVKFHGGCWATVRVREPLLETMAQDYAPGTEFDIKVALYSFEEST
jgi:hypothetical protein